MWSQFRVQGGVCCVVKCRLLRTMIIPGSSSIAFFFLTPSSIDDRAALVHMEDTSLNEEVPRSPLLVVPRSRVMQEVRALARTMKHTQVYGLRTRGTREHVQGVLRAMEEGGEGGSSPYLGYPGDPTAEEVGHCERRIW